MNTQQQEYLSQSELGRLLNKPLTALRRAANAGLLDPDLIVGKTKLFSITRLKELQAIIK